MRPKTRVGKRRINGAERSSQGEGLTSEVGLIMFAKTRHSQIVRLEARDSFTDRVRSFDMGVSVL